MADIVEVIKTPLSLVIDSSVSNASAVISASSNITASVDWTGVSSKPSTIASATISASSNVSASVDWSGITNKSSSIASATVSASTASVDWTGITNKSSSIASATISASTTTFIDGASVGGTVSFINAKPINFYNAAATPLLIGLIRGTSSYLLMQASSNFRITDVAGTTSPLQTFKIYSNDTEFTGDITANNIEALTSIAAPLIQSDSISTVNNGSIISARDITIARNLNVSGSAQISGKVNIGGNLQVDGTITTSSAASAGTLYLSSSAIRTWAASVTIPVDSGTGDENISIPSTMRGGSKRLYATVTERADVNSPRFIFSTSIGATSITIKAKNIVSTSSNDNVDVDVVIVSIEP